MKYNQEHHLNRFGTMINPEQRAAYYKKHIDSESTNLSTAENILLLDFYQERVFNEFAPIESEDLRYPSEVFGSHELRASVAEFLGGQWNLRKEKEISVENVFAVSGVSAALEILSFSLFKPKDEVLIPAPMWYGFPWSFRQRPQMNFVPFDTGGQLNLGDVKRAVKRNPNAKLLVITNPNNPLGYNCDRDNLNEIYDFFLEDKTRHIISDEIYACSNIGGVEFTSALSLDIYEKHGDRIHVTWGLSKDFGLSGFRVGFIVSKSPKVHLALKGDPCNKSMAWFSPLGSLNPYMLKRLFLDSSGKPDCHLANAAMDEYKNLLKNQYHKTSQRLQKNSIGYTGNNTGAIFFWLDLSEYLDSVPTTEMPDHPLCNTLYHYDDTKERRLCHYILDKAKVHLTRGQECFNTEPGRFRLCYTAERIQDVTRGIDNMAEELKKLTG